jgi:hypothetical protein
MAPTIGVFDSGFGGLTVLRALDRAASARPLRLSRRHGAPALWLQIAPHHCALRRAERAVSGQRARRGVSRDCMQHRQRLGARRHSGCRFCSRAGRHRARRSRRPRCIAHRRRTRNRHRSHGAEPRLRGCVPLTVYVPLRKPARCWFRWSRKDGPITPLPPRSLKFI